jgi:hypothetical protein
MGWDGAHRGKIRNSCKMLVCLERKDHLLDLGIDGSTVLKHVFIFFILLCVTSLYSYIYWPTTGHLHAIK